MQKEHFLLPPGPLGASRGCPKEMPRRCRDEGIFQTERALNMAASFISLLPFCISHPPSVSCLLPLLPFLTPKEQNLNGNANAALRLKSEPRRQCATHIYEL